MGKIGYATEDVGIGRACVGNVYGKVHVLVKMIDEPCSLGEYVFCESHFLLEVL